jgi:hypothetical protein
MDNTHIEYKGIRRIHQEYFEVFSKYVDGHIQLFFYVLFSTLLRLPLFDSTVSEDAGNHIFAYLSLFWTKLKHFSNPNLQSRT